MSFPGPPPPARPYASLPGEDPPAPGFRSALTAALEATESVEDVVVDQPAADRTRTGDPTQPQRSAPAGAPAGDGADRGVRVVAHDDGWKVTAPTLQDAVAATATLGRVTLHDARQVARGVGPWRRTHVELTARPANAAPSRDAEGAAAGGCEPPSTGDAPDAAADFEALFGAFTGAVAVEDPGTRGDRTGDTPEPAVAGGTGAPDSGTDPGCLPRPVLPPPLPDLTGVDVPAALEDLGLAPELVADACSAGPVTAEQWREALADVAAFALHRAGALDPVLGGAVTSGVGARGAAQLITAAGGGGCVGDLTWRGVTAPARPAHLAIVLVHGVATAGRPPASTPTVGHDGSVDLSATLEEDPR